MRDETETEAMSESNWWVEAALDWVARKALFEKVTFELTSEWQEGTSRGGPGEGSGSGEPEAGINLVCLKSKKKELSFSPIDGTYGRDG